MIINGIRIAEEIEARVAASIERCTESGAQPPRLRVFTCQPTFATQRFLALKSARAKEIGVALAVEECSPESSVDGIINAIREAIPESDGIIVQLPFPPHLDSAAILNAIPASHDVDAMGAETEKLLEQGTSLVLPPVVGAIAEIIARHNVQVKGESVVVVGEGRLVGAPAAVWFRQQGAHVQTINKKTEGLARFAREADILVLGAGVAGLITPEMIREGVVIFDAGSSEDTGKLVGDADPACAEKSALFTPVPGGIGPITVALIFRNLLTLIEHRL